jgi:Fe-S oxidoreductase
VFLNRRGETRQGAFQIKMKEADATGAGSVVTACGHCRMTFGRRPAVELADTDRKPVELVAENLAE